MFRAIKTVFVILIIATVAFLYWFLPKYNFIKKNPSFCVALSNNVYYCGGTAQMQKLFETKN
jgi:hypothetical protein